MGIGSTCRWTIYLAFGLIVLLLRAAETFPLQLPVLASSLAVVFSDSASTTTSTTMITTAMKATTISDLLQSKQQDSSDLPCVVYTIAGSDSGGGAGIQTDLHTIKAFGCHGCSAITCLTAQNSQGVTAIHTPPVQFWTQQFQALANDIKPKAIKIGMLGTAPLAQAVGEALSSLSNCPTIVLDPVMISTSGSRLLDADAEAALVQHVFPHVDILTPNKYEAEALLKRKLVTKQDVEDGARELLESLTKDGAAILIKGGHSNETNSYAQDYLLSKPTNNHDETILPRLCDSHLEQGVWLRSPRYDTIHTHGTGCTLSSAIASAMAHTYDPVDACCLAKAYVSAGIQAAIPVGSGPGPVAHGKTIRAEHFPSIPLVEDTDETFRSVDDLGTVLPIVDSLEWIQRLCDASQLCSPAAQLRDVQLRIKGVTDVATIEEMVQQCQEACSKSNIRLWVNDYWRAAIKAGCFGVHLGQEDLYKCVADGGLAMMRQSNVALGISTHSYGELAAALGVRPSYISLGPVFPTTSKNVQFDPQGLETVRIWRGMVPSDMPLVAIGGINSDSRAEFVGAAGADCVAVIGAVTQHRDPAAIANTLEQLHRVMQKDKA